MRATGTRRRTLANRVPAATIATFATLSVLVAFGLVQATALGTPAAPACPPPDPATTSPAPLSGVEGAASSPYRPAPEQVVACVGANEISGATFAHWATVAEHGEGHRHRGSAEQPTRTQMLQVMGFLISADWVIGEATELHIAVSAAAVRRRFDRLRHLQFPKRREYVAFLKHTDQTNADLLLRVRLSMLSDLIQRHVVGHHRDARARQMALEHFVRRFQDKWKALTYCEPLYATADCGHTDSSL